MVDLRSSSTISTVTVSGVTVKPDPRLPIATTVNDSVPSGKSSSKMVMLKHCSGFVSEKALRGSLAKVIASKSFAPELMREGKYALTLYQP